MMTPAVEQLDWFMPTQIELWCCKSKRCQTVHNTMLELPVILYYLSLNILRFWHKSNITCLAEWCFKLKVICYDQ